MKKIILVFTLLSLLLSLTFAQNNDKSNTQKLETENQLIVSESFAEKLQEATSLSISPLLMFNALSAYKYFNSSSEEYSLMPWYISPFCWSPLLILTIALTIVAQFNTQGADAAKNILNKTSALFIGLLFLPSDFSFESFDTIETMSSVFPTNYAAIGFSFLNSLLILPKVLFLVVIYFIYSFFFQAIDTLILISPFKISDFILRSFKGTAILLVLISYTISIILGIILSIILLIISMKLLAWSIRLSIFGGIFSWDILTLKWRRIDISREDETLLTFTSKKINGVPKRTMGWISRKNKSELVFKYKPLMLFKERSTRIAYNDDFNIGRSILSPILFTQIGDDQLVQLFRFPPRYRKHETAISEILTIKRVKEVGILKSFKSAKAWLKEVFHFGKDEVKLEPLLPEG